MKVFLIKKVQKLGNIGEIKSVSDGYALNYLIPQGFAKLASEDFIERQKNKKQNIAKKQKRDTERAEKMKRVLDGNSINIHAKASPEGTLFAAVKQDEVIHAVQKDFGIKLKDSQLKSFPQIKKIGQYNITIALIKGVEAHIQMNVNVVK